MLLKKIDLALARSNKRERRIHGAIWNQYMKKTVLFISIMQPFRWSRQSPLTTSINLCVLPRSYLPRAWPLNFFQLPAQCQLFTKMKSRAKFEQAPIDLTRDDDESHGKPTKIPLKQKTLKKKTAQATNQKNNGKRPVSFNINNAVTERKNMKQAFSQNPDYFEDATFVSKLQDPNTRGCEPGKWFFGDTIDIFLKTTQMMLNNPEVPSSSDNYSMNV